MLRLTGFKTNSALAVILAFCASCVGSLEVMGQNSKHVVSEGAGRDDIGCEISMRRRGDQMELVSIVWSRAEVFNGQYRFAVDSRSDGGISKTVQNGKIALVAGDVVYVGSVITGGGPNSFTQAQLTVRADKKDICMAQLQ